MAKDTSKEREQKEQLKEVLDQFTVLQDVPIKVTLKGGLTERGEQADFIQNDPLSANPLMATMLNKANENTQIEVGENLNIWNSLSGSEENINYDAWNDESLLQSSRIEGSEYALSEGSWLDYLVEHATENIKPSEEVLEHMAENIADDHLTWDPYGQEASETTIDNIV